MCWLLVFEKLLLPASKGKGCTGAHDHDMKHRVTSHMIVVTMIAYLTIGCACVKLVVGSVKPPHIISKNIWRWVTDVFEMC